MTRYPGCNRCGMGGEEVERRRKAACGSVRIMNRNMDRGSRFCRGGRRNAGANENKAHSRVSIEDAELMGSMAP